MSENTARTRLTSKRDPHKAKALFERVRAVFKRGVVIAECRDGDYWVAVCGGTIERDLWRWLWLAAKIGEKPGEAARTPMLFELPEKPEPLPDRSGPPRKPEVKRNAEGELIAPPGETFLFCGECGGTRFYHTMMESTIYPRRHICCACGNEIKNLISGIDFPNPSGQPS